MLIKLLVYGLFGYLKNGYNLFDGFIVIIRFVPAETLHKFA